MANTLQKLVDNYNTLKSDIKKEKDRADIYQKLTVFFAIMSLLFSISVLFDVRESPLIYKSAELRITPKIQGSTSFLPLRVTDNVWLGLELENVGVPIQDKSLIINLFPYTSGPNPPIERSFTYTIPPLKQGEVLKRDNILEETIKFPSPGKWAFSFFLADSSGGKYNVEGLGGKVVNVHRDYMPFVGIILALIAILVVFPGVSTTLSQKIIRKEQNRDD